MSMRSITGDATSYKARRLTDVPHHEYVYVSFLPSRTKQAMRDECDINNIMERYRETGLITHMNKYEGTYADLTDVVDYATAWDVINQANEMFMTLPANVRRRFGDDPGEFLAFVDNPANSDAIYEMGLARKREAPPLGVQEPAKASVTDKPEAAPGPAK